MVGRPPKNGTPASSWTNITVSRATKREVQRLQGLVQFKTGRSTSGEDLVLALTKYVMSRPELVDQIFDDEDGDEDGEVAA